MLRQSGVRRPIRGQDQRGFFRAGEKAVEDAAHVANPINPGGIRAHDLRERRGRVQPAVPRPDHQRQPHAMQAGGRHRRHRRHRMHDVPLAPALAELPRHGVVVNEKIARSQQENRMFAVRKQPRGRAIKRTREPLRIDINHLGARQRRARFGEALLITDVRDQRDLRAPGHARIPFPPDLRNRAHARTALVGGQQNPHAVAASWRIGLAGTPATIALAGTLRVTTAFAPTTASSPM